MRTLPILFVAGAAVLLATTATADLGTILTNGAEIDVGHGAPRGTVTIDPCAPAGFVEVVSATPLPQQPAFVDATPSEVDWGDGSLGRFEANSDVTLPGGRYDYTRYLVASGATVTYEGPVDIRCTEDAVVLGRVESVFSQDPDFGADGDIQLVARGSVFVGGRAGSREPNIEVTVYGGVRIDSFSDVQLIGAPRDGPEYEGVAAVRANHGGVTITQREDPSPDLPPGPSTPTDAPGILLDGGLVIGAEIYLIARRSVRVSGSIVDAGGHFVDGSESTFIQSTNGDITIDAQRSTGFFGTDRATSIRARRHLCLFAKNDVKIGPSTIEGPIVDVRADEGRITVGGDSWVHANAHGGGQLLLSAHTDVVIHDEHAGSGLVWSDGDIAMTAVHG